MRILFVMSCVSLPRLKTNKTQTNTSQCFERCCQSLIKQNQADTFSSGRIFASASRLVPVSRKSPVKDRVESARAASLWFAEGVQVPSRLSP